MPESAAAAPLHSGFVERIEAERAMEYAWIAAAAVLFLATLVPWVLGALDLRLSRVTLLMAAYVAVSWARVQWRTASPDEKPAPWLHPLTLVGNSFLLAVMWHMLGGLANPVALLAFFIPVCAAGTLSVRLDALRTALIAIAAVAVLALWESPDLQWYLAQFGLPLQWLIALVPLRSTTTGPFAGVQLTPAFQLTTLAAFAAMMLATALVSRALGSRLRELVMRARHPGVVLGDSAFAAAFDADPAARVLIHSDNAQIAAASRGFLQRMVLTPRELHGKSLFEILVCDAPRDIQRLLRLPHAEIPFVPYRVGPEARIADVRTFAVSSGGREYAMVEIHDCTELAYLTETLNAIREALIVTLRGQTVVYYNEAAAALFDGIHLGMEIASTTGVQEGPPRWWAPSSSESQLVVQGRRHVLYRTVVQPRGPEQSLMLLRFVPLDAQSRERQQLPRSA